jgi:hypothetical protein
MRTTTEELVRLHITSLGSHQNLEGKTSVIKPGQTGRPGTRSTRWLNRSGFTKRPAGAIARSNPGEPAGRPMTRANPDETRFFFPSNVGFETH